MTLRRGWVLGAVATALVALVACSSSSSSGSNNSCVAASAPSPACYSCGQSMCGSQLSTYESDCGSYISCSCPGGTYSATAAMSSACTADVTGTCQTADQALGACVQQNCASPCSASDAGGG
jgi:hypothetical protein